MMKRLGLGLVAGVVLGALAAPASADTITAIELSAYYGGANGVFSGDWSGEVGGSSIITAPTSGNQNTGITFTDWSGHYVAVPSASMNDGSNALTIDNFSPITLTAGMASAMARAPSATEAMRPKANRFIVLTPSVSVTMFALAARPVRRANVAGDNIKIQTFINF